jgi:hypothetical protein
MRSKGVWKHVHITGDDAGQSSERVHANKFLAMMRVPQGQQVFLGGVVMAVVVATLAVISLRLRLRLRLRRLRSPCVSIRSLVVFGGVCRQIYEARLLPHKGAVAPGQVRRRYPL